ncbi:MAG: site-2 protease family protein [Dehalococcoidia bacterium]|nr:site-2 protease family protein [Dehalococcoidia bacterium]
MGNGFRVGSVMGIPIIVNPSWFLILFILLFVLASQFAGFFPRWESWQHWAAAAVTTLLFFASVLAHELCHSLLARRNGIPVKGITFFLLGGVSQIGREANRPSTEFLIAVVGPLCSLVLGGLFIALAYAVKPASEHAWGVLALLAQVNLVLGVFNLVPAFPLDGGRVLRSALWAATHDHAKATVVAARISQAAAIAMVIGGLLLTLFGGDAGGIWMALIGWFLFTSATSSLRQQQLEEALRPLQAKDIMAGGLPVATADRPASQAVEQLLLPVGAPCLLITADGVTEGVVTPAALRKLPRSRWATTPIGTIAVPLSRFRTLAPGEAAVLAVEMLEGAPEGVVLVLEGPSVLGGLTPEGVSQRLRAMQTLGMLER